MFKVPYTMYTQYARVYYLATLNAAITLKYSDRVINPLMEFRLQEGT